MALIVSLIVDSVSLTPACMKVITILHSNQVLNATVSLIFSGVCNEFSNNTFFCRCAQGWQGNRCQSRIDHCTNITCQNDGVCRSLPLDHECECLAESYSGRSCEIKSRRLVTRQIISKSWACVAIVALGLVAAFIVAIDVLKYVFGVDFIGKRAKKTKAKKCKPSTYVRFTYVA